MSLHNQAVPPGPAYGSTAHTPELDAIRAADALLRQIRETAKTLTGTQATTDPQVLAAVAAYTDAHRAYTGATT